MNKINEIRDYGLLAEMAYLKLENENFEYDKPKAVNAFDREEYKKKYNIHRKEDIINFLNARHVNGEFIEIKKDIKLNDEQYKDLTDIDRSLGRDKVMIDLLDRFKIIDFTSDDGLFSSDFQATLFQNISTKDYIIAFRGTAGFKDMVVDAALANIFGSHNYQENEALDFVENMMKKHKFSKSSLTFTGHSLGGIIAQIVGVKEKVKTYTYNALGTSTLVNDSGSFGVNMIIELLESFDIIDYSDDWIDENILNISLNDIGYLNGDILSNLATKVNNSKHLGMKIDFFGKNVSAGDGHSIITLNQLLEKQSSKNLTTIDDIKNYNKNEKTLFLDIMLKNKIDIIATLKKEHKCLFVVQTTNEIKPLLSHVGSLVSALNLDTTHSLKINANITELENKNNFHNKLYYNFKKNQIKVKTKNFHDADDILIPFMEVNDKLKKHDIIIELQGE